MNNIRDWVLAGKPPVDEPLLRIKKRPRNGPSRAAEEESFADVPIRREAIRQANHRDGDRHRLDDETAEIIHGDRTQTVILVNLSGGGAMIEGAEGVKLWDRLQLRLGDNGHIEAAVRWVRGDRLGLEFAQQTHIDGGREETIRMLRAVISRSYPDLLPSAEEAEEDFYSSCPQLPQSGEREDDEPEDEDRDLTERELRHSLIWSGHIHYDHDSIPVRLRNISAGGALIECGHTLAVGAELLLELDKAGSFFATVNWAHGDTAGLRFHQTFDIQRLAAARPTVAAQRWVAPDYLRDSTTGNSPWTKQWGRDDPDPGHRKNRSIRRR